MAAIWAKPKDGATRINPLLGAEWYPLATFERPRKEFSRPRLPRCRGTSTRSGGSVNF